VYKQRQFDEEFAKVVHKLWSYHRWVALQCFVLMYFIRVSMCYFTAVVTKEDKSIKSPNSQRNRVYRNITVHWKLL